MKRLTLLLVLTACTSHAWAEMPALPRVLLDTSYRQTTPGATTSVASGANLQTAINNASCGDTLELQAGATFTGNFTLPDKSCTDSTWVYIRTATPDGTFPRAGSRVNPTDHAALMPTITGTGLVLAGQSGADHYRLVGIRFEATAAFDGALVQAGFDSSTTVAALGTDYVFDRCLFIGHATSGKQRGLAINAARVGIIDSHFEKFMRVGIEAQAIAGWNFPGPLKIVNNYIEGAGENILLGGADPGVTNLVPEDIEIRRNYFFKPLTWKVDDPSYAGTHWTIKNLLELKSARRALIEHNLFKNVWADAQAGYAVLFTGRNSSGGCTECAVQDITFRYNHIDSMVLGFQILTSSDNAFDTLIMGRLAFSDNLLTNFMPDWGGTARGGLINGGQDGGNNLTFQNNSFIGDDTYTDTYLYSNSADNTNLVIRYNISQCYGFAGDGQGVGSTPLNVYAPSAIYTENVHWADGLGTCNTTRYPDHSGNLFTTDQTTVGWVNFAGGNYRLDSSSVYDTVGPGGRDYGVFFPAAGQSFLDAEVQQSGTSAIIRFGRPGLVTTQTCIVRYGATSTSSTSGGSRRTLVLTALTNAQSYHFSADCGDADGDFVETLFTAVTPSGGDRTIPIQIPAPPSFLSTAERCTLQYDDNAAMATPTSVPDTTCSTGSTLDITAPAGVQYYRVLRLTSGDVEVARTGVQPILVQ